MERIRFAVAGTGWRAMFYVRAARMLPERFELTGVLCRTPERAQEFEREHGVRAFAGLPELLETEPEFVVSCVSKADMAQMVTGLLEAGMPALSETPLAADVTALRALYETHRRTGTMLELAEQYFLYPTHQARRAVIDQGLLGQVTLCQLSMMHGYHAVSMFRFYMGEANGALAIRARRVKSPLVITGGRGGFVTDGMMGEEERVLAQLDYADGRLGLYDFAGTQYHSAIRSSHVRILGTHGELFDDEVRCLLAGNRPMRSRLEVRRDGITGTIRAVDFEGERVYVNRFRTDVAMSEDEIAVCDVLDRMGEAVRTGAMFYPLPWAFEDAYVACLLSAAADESGSVHTVPMDWD